MYRHESTRTGWFVMASLTVTIALAAAQVGWAQGVAPPLGGTLSTYELNTGTNGWAIPDANDPPIVVTRDPSGPPWPKDLVGPGGTVLTANPGDTYFIRERLVIGGTLNWSDWHEEILTPGWEWNPSALPPEFRANGSPAPGLTVTNTPGTSTMGGILDFYFNSLPPGTNILISKAITYSGAGLPTPTPTFSGSIRVDQYPTPEPASAILLAAGGLLWGRRRRQCS